MDMLPLQASARDAALTAQRLRQSGKVPSVVYGNEMQAMSIQCDRAVLHKTFVKAGESTLVELDVEGKKIPCLFKDVSFHPVSGLELHVDFYAVNMKQEIETAVPLHYEGEAPAVKELGGIFVSAKTEVTVRCLPKDLPHALTVDVTGLANFHETIHIKDIKLPAGVTIVGDENAVVATVQEPRKEEEVVVAAATPAEGEAAAAAPGAEGAAAAPGAEAAAAGKEGGGEKK